MGGWILRKVRRRSVPSVLRRVFFTGVALAALACTRAERPARVDIVEPVDGAVVSGHLFIDRPLTRPGDTIPAGVTGIIHLGRGQMEFVLQGLAAGTHSVIAVLADWAHLPLDPLTTDTVRFTVRP